MDTQTAIQIANKNFQNWNSALQTKRPETVAALYDENASFLPTVASRKEGRVGAQDYFVHFLKKNPFGTIIEETIQTAGNTIIHSGLYDFEVGPDERRSMVHGRFTFVWKQLDNQTWTITHHHSSVDPET